MQQRPEVRGRGNLVAKPSRPSYAFEQSFEDILCTLLEQIVVEGRQVVEYDRSTKEVMVLFFVSG